MDTAQNFFSSLQSHLLTIEDPRQSHKVTYSLSEILFLVISAVISDCSSYEEMVDFGEDNMAWLRKYYPYKDGIASHDTLNRVLGLLRPSSFMSFLSRWFARDIKLELGRLLSLDGKRLRSSATKQEQQRPKAQGGRSAVHVLEAWCDELSLTLGMRQVEDKENEIVAIPLILNDLEIEGCVVRIDAIGCQRDIAAQIQEQKAEYILGLRANHPNFLAEVVAAFEAEGPSCEATRFDEGFNLGHGRIEHRLTRVLNAEVLRAERLADWQGLKSIVSVESQRFFLNSDKVERETRYYISSLNADAKIQQAYIRRHWGIENRLHYCLDVFWGEDISRKRAGNAAVNFAVVLRIAHNLTLNHPDKVSLARKRKKANRSNLYREQVLGLEPVPGHPH
jgi:predicted transposase YbfD/YdcC